MIERSQDLLVEHRSGEKNGKITTLLRREQMHEKNRLFARVLLHPGAMVPYHEHSGDAVAYYILAGVGEVNDNGVVSKVNPGDVIFTVSGESHSLKNIGDEDLEYIALIILD